MVWTINEATVTVEFASTDGLQTAVTDVCAKAVASVRCANMQGMVSNQPFDGLNIVVATYTDGATVTEKNYILKILRHNIEKYCLWI